MLKHCCSAHPLRTHAPHVEQRARRNQGILSQSMERARARPSSAFNGCAFDGCAIDGRAIDGRAINGCAINGCAINWCAIVW